MGLGIVLKVMAGDAVNIFGRSYHKKPVAGYTLATTGILVSEIINALTGSGTLSGKGITGAQITGQAGFSTTLAGLVGNQPAQNTNQPRAGINWILLDEQFKYVNGGFDMVGTATGTTGTSKVHNAATIPAIAVNKSGYIYVWVSNESKYDVFFDNLQVTHNRGPILEETHYYPFRLVMSGISSKALNNSPANKYKYNGIEQNSDFDLNVYDAFYRNLDPQIGRFWQIDPVTTHTEGPYVSMGNNPVLNKDWLGDYFTWANATVEDTYKRLRQENSNRLGSYMEELAGLDLNSDDKSVQKQVKQLTNLINAHADLNSQWNEMEESGVEFHVSSEMPARGALADTKFSVDPKRINIRMGSSESSISTMSHELRHGYAYLSGEVLGMTRGSDPLIDMMDEVVAYNVGYLFLDRNTANRVADGFYDLNWFKSTHLSPNSVYNDLIGREEQLTVNTAAAVYMKYNPSDRIAFVLSIKNNVNMPVSGALEILNKQSQKLYSKPEYYTGNLLNNR